MKRKILYPTLATLLLLASCETKDANTENTTPPATTETLEEVAPAEKYDYAADWKILQTAFSKKDKATVLSFVPENDGDTKAAIDLSFDYAFDDEFIAKIFATDYSQLKTSEISGKDLLEFGVFYSSIEDGVEYESGIYIYLMETPEGLKLVNFLAAG